MVLRNKHTPVIAEATNATISRSQALSQIIARVRATDLDRPNTNSSTIRYKQTRPSLQTIYYSQTKTNNEPNLMYFCRYSIDFSKSEPATGINYFMINETSGGIYVYRSLELDTLRTTIYRLNVIAQDQGRPVLSLFTHFAFILTLILLYINLPCIPVIQVCQLNQPLLMCMLL